MRLGKLNKRINIVHYVDAENDIGGTELTPQVFLACWAAIEPARGREYYDAQKIRAETSYKITTRYHKGITEAMAIEYNGHSYSIQNILDSYEAHTSLEMYCIEKVRGAGNTS
jgi:phage head-tail adaptor, putative, SPP1 family